MLIPYISSLTNVAVFHGDSIADAIKHAKMGGHNELVTYLSSIDV